MDVQERGASRGELPAGDTAGRQRIDSSSDDNDNNNDNDNVKESDVDVNVKKSDVDDADATSVGGPASHTASHDNVKKSDGDAGDVNVKNLMETTAMPLALGCRGVILHRTITSENQIKTPVMPSA